MGHDWGRAENRFERWRQREAGLRERRNGKGCWLERKEELDPHRQFMFPAFVHSGPLVMPGMMSGGVTAKVRVNASGTVMIVMVVTAEVRVQQWRTEGRQMQGRSCRDRDQRAQHPVIVGDAGRAVKPVRSGIL